MFSVPGHCNIEGNEEVDIGWTHLLNTEQHLTTVDNPNFGLNTQSWKQPDIS
jgi:hypothetical protein